MSLIAQTHDIVRQPTVVSVDADSETVEKIGPVDDGGIFGGRTVLTEEDSGCTPSALCSACTGPMAGPVAVAAAVAEELSSKGKVAKIK